MEKMAEGTRSTKKEISSEEEKTESSVSQQIKALATELKEKNRGILTTKKM